MARKLRIQYPGSMYHIINRGNYRKNLFESVGAAEAFLRVLGEAVPRFGWKLHAHVLRRNHYHLDLAQRIRDKTAVPYRWLAVALDIGRPESLRSYHCRHRGIENQRTTA